MTIGFPKRLHKVFEYDGVVMCFQRFYGNSGLPYDDQRHCPHGRFVRGRFDDDIPGALPLECQGDPIIWKRTLGNRCDARVDLDNK